MNRSVRHILATVTALLCAASALAGDPFAIQNNLEGLDHEDESVQALRVPVYLTLKQWQDRPYGLRLRLAATFATSDLYNFLEGDFEVHRVNSFVPGIEFVVPYRENHLFLPYLDVGAGRESESRETEVLGAVGLRTQFIFTGRKFITGLEPGFHLGSRPDVGNASGTVFSPNLTVSARRVLGFTIDGHEPDAGIFLEAGYDFNALEVTSVRSTNDAESAKWEVGVGFGFTRSMPKIWFFRWPRVRIGYRFGDLEGWRIRIGGDWLNAVLAPLS